MVDVITIINNPKDIENYIKQLKLHSTIPLNIIFVDLTAGNEVINCIKKYPIGIKLIQANSLSFDLEQYLKYDYFIFLAIEDIIPLFFFQNLVSSLESCSSCGYSYTHLKSSCVRVLFKRPHFSIPKLFRNYSETIPRPNLPEVFKELASRNIFGVYSNILKKK